MLSRRPAGDRGRRREQGSALAEEGRRHHEWLLLGAATALSADAQRHLVGEELHHHLPRSYRSNELFHQQHSVVDCVNSTPLTRKLQADSVCVKMFF